jgi:hypothetical protein
LYSDERVGTLAETLDHPLGGELLLSLCLYDLSVRRHLKLTLNVAADLPLWVKGNLQTRVALSAGDVPLQSRFSAVPEEGWKVRSITVGLMAYNLLGQAARHWLQNGLEKSDPRTPIGFKAAHKLWELTSSLKLDAKFADVPDLSADISNCTDSSPLEVNREVLFSWCEGLEEAGVSVPAIVWGLFDLTCSPHVFLYPDTENDSSFVVDEREHVTGVMMGEEASFIAMTLCNLILDQALADHDTDGDLKLAWEAGKLSAVVGDDFVRLRTPFGHEYARNAYNWFAWTVSPGKHGLSNRVVQLAEEIAIRKGSSQFMKLDVIKIKYLSVPGTSSGHGEVPAWVGRARALTRDLDWARRDGLLSATASKVLAWAFRIGNNGIPADIPYHWTLPYPLGGICFPAGETLSSILRKSNVEFSGRMLLAVPLGEQWKNFRELRRLNQMHSGHGAQQVEWPASAYLTVAEDGLGDDVTFDPEKAFAISAVEFGRWLVRQSQCPPEAIVVTGRGERRPIHSYLDLKVRELNLVRLSELEVAFSRRETFRYLVENRRLAPPGTLVPKPHLGRRVYTRLINEIRRTMPCEESRWSEAKTQWKRIRSLRNMDDFTRELESQAADLLLTESHPLVTLFQGGSPWNIALQDIAKAMD